MNLQVWVCDLNLLISRFLNLHDTGAVDHSSFAGCRGPVRNGSIPACVFLNASMNQRYPQALPMLPKAGSPQRKNTKTTGMVCVLCHILYRKCQLPSEYSTPKGPEVLADQRLSCAF